MSDSNTAETSAACFGCARRDELIDSQARTIKLLNSLNKKAFVVGLVLLSLNALAWIFLK